MELILNLGIKHFRKVLMILAGVVHGLLILALTFQLGTSAGTPGRESAEVFKLVDVQELPPPPVPVAPEAPEEVVTVTTQSSSAAEVVETDKVVVETAEPEYLPQHKISTIPVLPSREILARILYPDLAARQGLEGVVYLELYIDAQGMIRKSLVLKDPGFGFAAAALAALEGVRCQPATANGVPVAVKFRYPVRFSLK